MKILPSIETDNERDSRLARASCEHKTIVGGNDCRWCADCGADFKPHVDGLEPVAPTPCDSH